MQETNSVQIMLGVGWASIYLGMSKIKMTWWVASFSLLPRTHPYHSRLFYFSFQSITIGLTYRSLVKLNKPHLFLPQILLIHPTLRLLLTTKPIDNAGRNSYVFMYGRNSKTQKNLGCYQECFHSIFKLIFCVKITELIQSAKLIGSSHGSTWPVVQTLVIWIKGCKTKLILYQISKCGPAQRFSQPVHIFI